MTADIIGIAVIVGIAVIIGIAVQVQWVTVMPMPERRHAEMKRSEPQTERCGRWRRECN